MATQPEFASAGDQATIADCIEDRVKEASKGTVKVKTTKTTKTTKPSIDAIKARGKKTKEVSVKEILAAVEDAPF
jgi:hypothetical protein